MSGGLNSSYSIGTSATGTSPIVAATNLSAGEAVTVACQGGNVDAGLGFPSANCDGWSGKITGKTPGNSGGHHPTFYMYDLTRGVGQQIQFTATLQNASGNPISGTTVSFTVAGVNAQTLSATTDSYGHATVTYIGASAGIDTVQAQATPSGGSTINTGTSTVIWIPSATISPSGTLQLTPASVSPATVSTNTTFTVLARDGTGTAIPGLTINLIAGGADNRQLQSTTNGSGQATFTYTSSNPGTVVLTAAAPIAGSIMLSNAVTTSWTPSSGSASAIGISIQANPTVTQPNLLQLSSTVTDSSGTPTLTWSQIAGPGTTTFGNASLANTTASFSVAGNYILQLNANDGTNTQSEQVAITVNDSVGTQGWLGNPLSGSTLTGIVPVTVASGVTLSSGRLIYYSASDPYAQNPIVLNANVSGSGQIGTFDTTQLANGSYYLQLQATDSTGHSQYSVVLVNVAGQYKPGRVTTAVTDLVVPANGLAINIQRQYDSLNAGRSMDFGYGWALGINVDLSVDSSYNVTFTLAGQRRTFYFTPQFEFFFLGYIGGYTAEPGLPGSLVAVPDESECPFNYIVPLSSLWQCGTGAPYSPVGYVYTDASGTQYTVSASGALQSVKDIGGNTLTVTPNGITSSSTVGGVHLAVAFIRDTSGRIISIKDPAGNLYQYDYDSSGNLGSVQYPGIATPSYYHYYPNHFYNFGTDFRGNKLPVATYYDVGQIDPHGNSLTGRLASTTDALNETTSYAYDLTTNTTTVTYPPDASSSVGMATMVYDSYGMLLSSTDPNSLTTTNTYDPDHNLISVTDPLGHKTTYTYDANGNRTSVTYPSTHTGAHTTSFTTYNQNSEPTSSTDELGNTRTYNYDSNSWPTKVTDSIGTLMSSTFNANGTMHFGAIGYDISVNPTQESTFTYDTAGNRITATDALSHETAYTFNSLGQKVTLVEPNSTGPTYAAASTTYSYDLVGNLIETAAPLGRTTYSSYDSNGNKISDTDANSNVTAYAYDSLNRLITTTYPLSPATTVTNTYDFRGNIITQTDQAGNVTKNGYDTGGRLTSVTTAYGTANAATTHFSYYDDSRKHQVTDPLSNITNYVYDAAGRLTSVTTGYGTANASTTSYGYDDANNRASMTDGNSHVTAYVYDARKRLTTTTYPTSPATTVVNTYDGPGNLTSVQDQNGNTINYTYDSANHLQTVVQVNSPNSGQKTNTYGYDLLGNLGSLSDERTNVTNNSFNLLSQLTSKVLPDGSSTESRTYDAAGNLQTLTHFNGKTTTYAYDSLNRLITRTPDPTLSEPTVSFTYTPTGKRHTMTDGSGTTTYTYDTADRLISRAAPAGTLTYTYNGVGFLTSTTSSNTNGISVSYTYDSLNRLSTVVDNRLPSGHNTTTYSYDTASNVATAAYPNGLSSTFSYDNENRVTGLSTVTSSSTPVASYTDTLDPMGNRTGSTEGSGRTLTWSYDGIYRLRQEQIAADPIGNNGTSAYTLDPVGNRTSDTSSISGITAGSSTFNADDLLSTESYDLNGNATSVGGKTFAYDSENRLVSMNSGAVTLVYDGNGERVAKTVSGVTTKYLVDDLSPTGYPQVVEEVAGGTVTHQYTYGRHLISGQQVISSTWTPSFYGYDGGGNVRQLTNSSGTITDTYSYDAFGNELNSSGSSLNSYLYRGEQFDLDLGLQYLRARYYNPTTGRFLSRDPANGVPTDPKTLHKYLYAGGDPVNRRDPSGRDQIEVTTTDAIDSEGEIVEEKKVAEDESCVVNAEASTLENSRAPDGVTLASLTPNFKKCDALAKLKCTVGQKVFRVFGGPAPLYGRSWSPVDPRTVFGWRAAAGVETSWGNTGEQLAEGYLVKADGCQARTSLPSPSNPSPYLPEIFFPNLSDAVADIIVTAISDLALPL